MTRRLLLALLAPCATLVVPAVAVAQGASAGGGRDTAAIVLALGVGALVLGLLVLWALAWWRAWDPPCLQRWRHATAEAGWRAGHAWAEFTDWLRLGR